MKQRAELVSATQEELDEILTLAKTTFPAKQYQLLERVLETFVYVMRALQNAKTSLKRFRQMLFGTKTESKHKLFKDLGIASVGDEVPQSEATTPTPGDHGENPPRAPAKPGHGRNGAQAYSDSPVIEIDPPNLKPGDPCPKCSDGKVYDTPPKTVVKVVGQSPLTATVFKLRQLRCRLCDATFTGTLPEGSSAPKYDHSCASMLALLRYGAGMPFYRLEGLQASLNVPLPDATQWEIVSKAVPGPKAVFNELVCQGAQAPLLHSDDTPAKILSLMAQRTKTEAAGQRPKNKAINTSGIVAVLAQGHKVVLFFTGHKHAGANLSDVLAHRARELQAPIQMSDALACNFTGEFKTVVSKCIAHARRKVVDVMEHFPDASRYVIEVLAKVYANDAHCRDEKLSSEQRLLYHQAHSEPPMQELHRWMNDQFDQRLVEPNSALGQALRYFLNHWSGLTLFLRKAGTPLDNNIVERALKRAIRHRNNSLFYKTTNGAQVGDIYMSLIHTCALCHVNPFEYLQALQIHVDQAKATPALWLPWNYREQLAHAR
ncbi:MAG: IS66 family transposase [Rhodoferax sp.]|nr:IS66 family transposase [Rhodoferax sp.]